MDSTVTDLSRFDTQRAGGKSFLPSAKLCFTHRPSVLKTPPLTGKESPMSEKPNVTLPGTVEKIIPSPHPSEPEKAQIAVKDGDDLYKEIRIENALQDEDGNEVALKEGAEVEVTVEADKKDTTPKR
jgi:hypothetical protein